MRSRKCRHKQDPLSLERLEPRLVLANVAITEFMADNGPTLDDGDGNSSDWFEVRNLEGSPTNLSGWHATDDPGNLTKWSFPNVTLAPFGAADNNDFLVLFASAQTVEDYVDAEENLHTNFALNANGDYIALVDPTNTIVSEYGAGGANFPEQRRNVSFGLDRLVVETPLVLAGAAADILVPDETFDSTFGSDWTGGNEGAFLGAGGLNGWTTGTSSVGYAQSIGRAELAHHWQLDGDLADRGSTGGLDLSLQGGTALISGATCSGIASGQTGCLDLNGATNTYAFSDVGVPFTTEIDHTFMAWVFHDTIKIQRWVSWGKDVGGGGRYFIGPGTGIDVDMGYIQVGPGGARTGHIAAPGVWHHYALVANAGANTQQLFVDGFPTGTPGSLAATGTIDPANQFRLGNQFDDPNSAIEGLNGKMADVAFFFETLDETQIQKAMNSGAQSIGGVDLGPLVQTDIEAEMAGVNSTAYVRIPFEVSAPLSLDTLTLRVQHDDGFVAYLDGQEIARRNAPPSSTWNSVATTDRPEVEALVFEEIDVSSHIDLLTAGSHFLAVQGLNDSSTSSEFLISPELIGTRVAESVVYFETPTPGEENSVGSLGLVEDTTFDVDRGFYDAPFDVDIRSATPGAAISYTTDGSEPTLTSGTVVNAPDANTAPTATVHIATTTTLRAAAFKQDHLSTNIDTQTYIFLDAVLSQDGAGQPVAWGPKPADYTLDENLIGPGGVYENTIRDDLGALPAISIVMDVDDLWGPSGIYSNSQGRGISWERAASFELIDPDGGAEIQVDAAIRIHGGGSRGAWMPKHSLRIYFKDEYGPPRLDFPLFPDSAVETFDVIILDARYNNSWLWAHHNVPDGPTTGAGRQFSQYLRDQWAWDTMSLMGHVSPHARPVYVYLNGQFWGLHFVHERADAGFAAAEFGGNKDDYDAIKGAWPQGGFEVNEGDDVAFRAMMNIISDPGRSGDQKFVDVQEYLDMDHFVDYILLQIYSGNTDLRERNWWATRKREPGGQFHFYAWDSEYMLLQITDDVTNFDYADSPWRIHQRLRASAEYRQKFADHVQRHMFRDGLLTPASVDARWMVRAAEIDRAVAAESVRWGDHRLDNQNDGITTGPVLTYTREGHWLVEQNRLRTTIFPVRTGVALAQLIDDNLYSSFNAPELQIDGIPQHGGSVVVGSMLSIVDPNSPQVGTIYFTIDGRDPRVAGGGISPSAQVFSDPLNLDSTLHVKARLFTGSEWSALTEAMFSLHPADATSVVISEIMFHPAEPTSGEITAGFTDDDDFEFVELTNISDGRISLADVSFAEGDPVTFNFSDGSILNLDAGDQVLVVRNQAAFEFRHGTQVSDRIAGEYGGRLSNAGEPLTLLDSQGNAIKAFQYDDSPPWPITSDGLGFSLTLMNPNGNPEHSDPSNWRGSGTPGGTPGTNDPVSQPPIVINEILSNPEPADVDRIELYNPTAADVDIGGWFLSDDKDVPTKYMIPLGTTIVAGGYLTISEDDDANPATTSPPEFFGAAFGLSSLGEEVYLLSGNGINLTGYDDGHSFAAALDREALGRWPNATGELFPVTRQTFGAANSGPRIGPLVFSEIMYNPPDWGSQIDPGQLEYLEIYNPTPQSVDLSNWSINGVNYTFPGATTIGPGEVLVIVPFDPLADTTAIANFEQTYQVALESSASQYVGPYLGRLDGGGEQLTLFRADQPLAEQPMLIPLVIEDRVRYDDAVPWSVSADGNGDSLQRRLSDLWGPDVANWAAASPTPGTLGPRDTYAISTSETIIADVGQVENLTHVPLTVTLNHSFNNPVVFALPASFNGSDPVVVRVKDVQSDRFTIFLAEPSNENGTHGVLETVSYIVVEAGSHWLADGAHLEVGTVTTAATVGRTVINPQWKPVDFAASFAGSPVVLSQVQTMDATSAEAYLDTRQRNVTSTGFQVALQQEERIQSQHVAETIGYLAMDVSDGRWSDMAYEAGVTPAKITEVFASIGFGQAFAAPPNFVASLASYNGADNAHLRFQNLAAGSVQLKVDEDTTEDSETLHQSAENVAYLVVNGDGLGSALTTEIASGNQSFAVTVPSTSRIVDINVVLDISHTRTADLSVSLQSPAGTSVELFAGVGGDGNHFRTTILDDNANHSLVSAAAPFAGVFRPQGNLADLNGEQAAGIWTLHVTDNVPNTDAGALIDWSLAIEFAPQPEGNFNHDAHLDAEDIDLLFANLGSDNAIYDLDGDGDTDVMDVDEFVLVTLGKNPGDADLDQDVDIADSNALVMNFDPTGQNPFNGWAMGNFDGDTDVDISDFIRLVRNFSPLGYTLTASASTVIVAPQDHRSGERISLLEEENMPIERDLAEPTGMRAPEARTGSNVVSFALDEALTSTTKKGRRLLDDSGGKSGKHRRPLERLFSRFG